MKQIINQNIQPVVYNNETYPLTFAYVIAESSIINANQTDQNGNITQSNIDFCLPKGLSILVEGPSTVISKNITSLSRSGTTVTATSTAHGLTTGNTVTISGATPTAFNGTFAIVVTGPNTFTYNVSSSGTDTATGSISLSATIKTSVSVALDKDRLVWITGKGAYLTKEGAWVPVPEITNLLNNSTKIYTTDKNGSYLVFDMSDISDPFNQIKYLKAGEGYLIVSNKAGHIPNYAWYESTSQDPQAFDRPQASFIYNQHGTMINVANNQKAVDLKDIEGTYDSYKKAGATLKTKLDNLQKGFHYRVVFSTDHTDTVFENTELYYGNNQLKSLIINNNIDIMSNLVNSVVTISLHLYENDVVVSSDSISIYINAPAPPASIDPPMVRPRFYLIGEG